MQQRKASVRKMVNLFGGPKKIADTYNEFSQRNPQAGWGHLPYPTVYSWIRENSLSLTKLMRLKTMADSMGIEFDFDSITTIEKEGDAT